MGIPISRSSIRARFEALTFPDEEFLLETQSGIEELTIQQHSSKKEGVDELRRAYDEEEGRRKSVESKTGAVIALNGILLGLTSTESVRGISVFLVFISIFLFICSTIFCVWNLWPRGYQQPLFLKEYPTYTRKDSSEYQTLLYKRYFTAVSFNSKQNDVCYRWFLVSISCTVVGILTIGSTSVILLS